MGSGGDEIPRTVILPANRGRALRDPVTDRPQRKVST
jgi:hypothetical protein